jgi:radical SAM protein with 4Fe4S-binding SPASM domain
MILMCDGQVFPLGPMHTLLSESDYGFLERFLDVTKANMFFARGVLIVEGDAENLLLPTLARLVGRDLTKYGVSIVNVGTRGLRRYARVFRRRSLTDGNSAPAIPIPVACLADRDIMPDCARQVFGLAEEKREGAGPRYESDLTSEESKEEWRQKRCRDDGENVKTFVSDHWTLEYDLAHAGLGEFLWQAVALAMDEARRDRDRASAVENDPASIAKQASREWSKLKEESGSRQDSDDFLACKACRPLRNGVSKPMAAQHLASLLEDRFGPKGTAEDRASFRHLVPRYIPACELAWDELTVSAWAREHARIGVWLSGVRGAGRAVPDIPNWRGLEARLLRGARRSSCGAGVRQAAVATDGRLFPCYWFVFAEGAEAFELGRVEAGFTRDAALQAMAALRPESARPEHGSCASCPARDGCTFFCPALRFLLARHPAMAPDVACTLDRARVSAIRFEDAWRCAVRAPVADFVVPVVSVEHLLDLKRRASRAQDLGSASGRRRPWRPACRAGAGLGRHRGAGAHHGGTPWKRPGGELSKRSRQTTARIPGPDVRAAAAVARRDPRVLRAGPGCCVARDSHV